MANFIQRLGKRGLGVDLEATANMYRGLQERHDKASALYSTIKGEIAKLDMHSSEDDYKIQKANEIESYINEAADSNFGNIAYAYDDLLRAGGDISLDPGILGRLDANKKYKDFQKSIDSAEIPEDYKEFYRTANPYKYEDKLDNEGNIVGGSKWQPNISPVKYIDPTEMMREAFKDLSPNKGSSSNTKFMDMNGNISNTFIPNKGMTVYNNTTSTWDKIDENKIRQAVLNKMYNNPEYIASLEQDYYVKSSQAKSNKINGIEPGDNEKHYNAIYNRNGDIVGKDEYIKGITEPWITGRAYNYQTNIVKYDSSAMNVRAKAAGSGVNKINYATPLAKGQNTTGLFKTEVGFASENNNNLNVAYEDLKDTLDAIGISLNLDDVSRLTSTDDILSKSVDFIQNSDLSDSEKIKSINEVKSYLNNYKSINMGNQFMANKFYKNNQNKEQRDSAEFMNAYNSENFNSISKDNSDYIAYDKFINNYFKGDNNVRITFNREKSLNQFKHAIGDTTGLIIKNEGGNYYVEIPKDGKHKFGKVLEAANVVRNNKWWGSRLFNQAGMELQSVTDNHITPISREMGSPMNSEDTTNWFMGMGNTIDSFQGLISSIQSKPTHDNEYAYIGGTNTVLLDRGAEYNKNILIDPNTDSGTMSKAKYNIEESEKLLNSVLRKNNLSDLGILAVNTDDDTGSGVLSEYATMSLDKLEELQNAKQNGYEILEIRQVRLPDRVGEFPQYTIKYKDGSDTKQTEFIVTKGLTGSIQDEYNNSTRALGHYKNTGFISRDQALTITDGNDSYVANYNKENGTIEFINDVYTGNIINVIKFTPENAEGLALLNAYREKEIERLNNGVSPENMFTQAELIQYVELRDWFANLISE